MKTIENSLDDETKRRLKGIREIENVLRNCHAVNYSELRRLIEGVYHLEKRKNYFFIKDNGNYVQAKKGKILRIPLSHSRGLSTPFYREVLKGVVDYFHGNSNQV